MAQYLEVKRPLPLARDTAQAGKFHPLITPVPPLIPIGTMAPVKPDKIITKVIDFEFDNQSLGIQYRTLPSDVTQILNQIKD